MDTTAVQAFPFLHKRMNTAPLPCDVPIFTCEGAPTTTSVYPEELLANASKAHPKALSLPEPRNVITREYRDAVADVLYIYTAPSRLAALSYHKIIDCLNSRFVTQFLHPSNGAPTNRKSPESCTENPNLAPLTSVDGDRVWM
jgi:hypothetical protein